MSIGEVLAQLRPEFPDVTISKIRFLEDQGLVEPDRAPSGYRRFSHADVDRLRYVLSVQRDHYLPLRVIREQLAAMDRGHTPPALPGRAAPARPGGPRLVPDAVAPADRFSSSMSANGTTRLTREELVTSARADERLVDALESFGMLAADPRTGQYDLTALAIVRTARELASFGLEPRHLRPFRTAADREAGLVEQVIAPLRQQRGQGPAGQAEEAAREVAALAVRLHAALLEAAIDRSLG
ncbi:MAG: MerR family transcriptional regulator [Kineosporiaceae bacterium]|nr:MerR family transcriptional regulator [Kineosporiaceae bacterium]